MSNATLSPSAARVKFRLAGGAQPLILVPVSVNEQGPFGEVVGTRLDGIVGYSFLRNYKVAFDYPNATLNLFPA